MMLRALSEAAFIATKISYVNAIAAVCEAVGADVNDVTLGMGYDKRIGAEFLRPGPGWGGSCFPKDSQALVNIAHESGFEFELLKSVILRHLLRRTHHHRPRQLQQLRHRERNIPGPRRQIDDQVIQITPRRLLHELLERAVRHRPAPHQRLVRFH